MQPFTRVTAAAVPIDLPNVDTDRVSPRASCGKDGACPSTRASGHDVRFNGGRVGEDEFVLTSPRFAGEDRRRRENFGLRLLARAAVWALAAYGSAR